MQTSQMARLFANRIQRNHTMCLCTHFEWRKSPVQAVKQLLMFRYAIKQFARMEHHCQVTGNKWQFYRSCSVTTPHLSGPDKFKISMEAKRRNRRETNCCGQTGNESIAKEAPGQRGKRMAHISRRLYLKPNAAKGRIQSFAKQAFQACALCAMQA